MGCQSEKSEQVEENKEKFALIQKRLLDKTISEDI